jgi:hypothetical protein
LLEEEQKMTIDRASEQQIKATMDFHGHWCPGLAIGVRAAELALEEVGKADDEDIVAIVETDMCAVDAIQYSGGLHPWQGQPDLPGLRQERLHLHPPPGRQGRPPCPAPHRLRRHGTLDGKAAP